MAAKLGELRRSRHVTQDELAALVGVELRTIQRWEEGTQRPGPAMSRKLAGALGVGIEKVQAALDEGGETPR
ncbi:MAG: helix-turn-helix transcriptional regulator [Thermomicrobiales bacterium]